MGSVVALDGRITFKKRGTGQLNSSCLFTAFVEDSTFTASKHEKTIFIYPHKEEKGAPYLLGPEVVNRQIRVRSHCLGGSAGAL